MSTKRTFDNWSATLDARDAQIDKLAQLGVDDWRRALELSDATAARIAARKESETTGTLET